MRRFKTFSEFSIFFNGVINSLQFLHPSFKLDRDALNVLETLEHYHFLCSDPFPVFESKTVYLLIRPDFCAWVESMSLSEVISFKKSSFSVYKVVMTSKCITLSNL